MTKLKVIKLGGSLLSKSDEILFDFDYFHKFELFLKDMIAMDYKFAINIGGGYVTRKYQKILDANNEHDEEDLHKLGIATTNLNAQIFHGLLNTSNKYPEVIRYESFDDFILGKISIDISKYSVIVLSSSKPGHSNDWNAMQTAVRLGTNEVLDLKNVDGVYTKDPNKFPDAQKIDSLTWDQYFQIIGNPKEFEPGGNYPVDIETARKAKENKVEFVIASGNDFQNIRNILEQKSFIGTTIQ